MGRHMPHEEGMMMTTLLSIFAAVAIVELVALAQIMGVFQIRPWPRVPAPVLLRKEKDLIPPPLHVGW
jgi:hypothetical protein